MTAHGGNIWDLVEEQGLSPEQVLDFSADLNPLGPPPHWESLLREAGPSLRRLPEPTYAEFRTAVARREGVAPDQILPGNGTSDLIHLISRLHPRSRASICVPTFTEYERAVLADGGGIFPWNGEDQSRFPSLKGIDLLFLCNPNNPTGFLWPKEDLLRLIRSADEAGAVSVVDETVMDLVEDRRRYSLIPQAGLLKRLIVLKSFSKSFAVPGLRIGALVASPLMVQRLARIQPPWVLNSLAASVGARLAQEDRFLEESRRRLSDLRAGLWEGLKGIPEIQPYPSAANFFLCRITDFRWTGESLAEPLRRQGILIRTCDDFTGLDHGRFVRISVRLEEENRRLLSALKEIFG